MNNEKQGAPWTPEEEERSNAKAWGGEWTPADESRLMARKWFREQHRTDYELLNPEQRVGFIQALINKRRGAINDSEMDLLLNQLKVARRQEQVVREARAPAPPQPSPQDSGAEDAQGRQEPPESEDTPDSQEVPAPEDTQGRRRKKTDELDELLLDILQRVQNASNQDVWGCLKRELERTNRKYDRRKILVAYSPEHKPLGKPQGTIYWKAEGMRSKRPLVFRTLENRLPLLKRLEKAG
jgi:hypothetical protein